MKQNPHQTFQELAFGLRVFNETTRIILRGGGNSASGFLNFFRSKQAPTIERVLVIAVTPEQSFVHVLNIEM